MCTWILLIKILHFYTVEMVPINCIAAKINVEITFNISLQKFRIFLEKFSFDWKPIFREHKHCYQVEIEFQKRKNFSDWFHASEIVWEYQRGGRSESCIYNPRIILTTNKQIQNENESWNFKLSYHDDEIMEQHRKEIYCNTLN